MNKSVATKSVTAPPTPALLQVTTPLSRLRPLAQPGLAIAARVLGLATSGKSRLLVKARGEAFDGMLPLPASQACLSTRPSVKNATKLIMQLCNAPTNVNVRACLTRLLRCLLPPLPRHHLRRPAPLPIGTVPAPTPPPTFLTPLLHTPSPLPEAFRPSLWPPPVPRLLLAPLPDT